MTALALTAEYVELNSVDQSDFVKSATLTMEAANLDSTTMGDGWVEATPGLKSGTLTIEFLDDFTDDGLDEDLWALFGTVTTFEIRPTDSAVGAANPSYTGSLLVAQHSIGGSVGELAGKSVSYPLSGTVTRATS
jgi:hypothetical protein